MVDAALNVAAEQVIEHSAYGALLERDGNRGPTAAPQNLYRTNEIDEFGRADCWVAVAVATDEQWAGLCEAVGRRDWATDPELSTAAGRRARHDDDRRAPRRVVRGPYRRRHRRHPVGTRCAGGQGDATAPPDRDSATGGTAASSRTSGTRSMPARRTAPCRSRSRAARSASTSSLLRCSVSTIMNCYPNSASPTRRSPTWKPKA